MRIDPKDKPKVIALVIVLLALWVFMGFRAMDLSREHKAKLKAEEEAHQKAHELAAEQARQTSPTLRLAALVAPVEPPTADPFHPVINPRRNQPESALRSAATQRPQTMEQPAALPVFPTPSGTETARSSRDSLTLTGVVMGTPATAVLRVGEEHYVVKVGDYLDGKLRVEKIGSNSVTLRDGRSSYVLRLGG
jgi:hypothetical protein